jgi:hypothetical protein
LGQTLLELHEIDRHDDALGLGEGAIVTRRRRKSRDRGLRFGANQEPGWGTIDRVGAMRTMRREGALDFLSLVAHGLWNRPMP